MNVLIIDDERDSREIIISYINQYFPKMNIVGEADSVNSGLELILTSEFDLIFLDIQLKNKTSFDILEKLTDFRFDIIFITAHDEYAIKAIKHHAMDYLLKPLKRLVFVNSVQAYLQESQRKNSEQFKSLVTRFKSSITNEQIKLPTLKGFKIVNIEDIIRLQSEGSYTHFFLANKETILVSKNLKIYEDLLPSNIFCRIHNTHLVNIKFIIEYIKGRGGQIILTNKTVLPVSNNRKDRLLEIWK